MRFPVRHPQRRALLDPRALPGVGPGLVPLLGLAAMAALAARTWWTGTDALPVSLALVAIAAILVVSFLWRRPRAQTAAALILLALLAGLML